MRNSHMREILPLKEGVYWLNTLPLFSCNLVDSAKDLADGCVLKDALECVLGHSIGVPPYGPSVVMLQCVLQSLAQALDQHLGHSDGKAHTWPDDAAEKLAKGDSSASSTVTAVLRALKELHLALQANARKGRGAGSAKAKHGAEVSDAHRERSLPQGHFLLRENGPKKHSHLGERRVRAKELVRPFAGAGGSGRKMEGVAGVYGAAVAVDAQAMKRRRSKGVINKPNPEV
ncbi:unnamed protein product [Chrysoparadoxa australica]